ncbi:unnamed protein product [Linum trigynum]|uniref:Uncharacterized protein n=1 Tax=Linum trigynum TaxID=586398 RepID=A0AAV2G4G9_9ROSI
MICEQDFAGDQRHHNPKEKVKKNPELRQEGKRQTGMQSTQKWVPRTHSQTSESNKGTRNPEKSVEAQLRSGGNTDTHKLPTGENRNVLADPERASSMPNRTQGLSKMVGKERIHNAGGGAAKPAGLPLDKATMVDENHLGALEGDAFVKSKNIAGEEPCLAPSVVYN